MLKSKTLRLVCGSTLVALTLLSAALAIAGIWGLIEGDTAGQLFGTFLTVSGAAVGITYIADQFFEKEGK